MALMWIRCVIEGCGTGAASEGRWLTNNFASSLGRRIGGGLGFGRFGSGDYKDFYWAQGLFRAASNGAYVDKACNGGVRNWSSH